MNPIVIPCALFSLMLYAIASEAAPPPLPRFTVRAVKHDYRNAPITVTLPGDVASKYKEADALYLDDGSTRFLPCQYVAGNVRTGKPATLVFVLAELKQGKERAFTLKKGKIGSPAVTLTNERNGIEIKFDNHLFTRYVTESDANKPYFYPILTSEGTHYTRRYPLEKATGESNDHIHHKGLWFTHGDVNGTDFWSETPTAGKTVTKTIKLTMPVGMVFGSFQATTDWIAKDGKTIATDIRHVKVMPLADGASLLDFQIEIKPTDAPLTFGDTKEGSFGMRVAETLAPKPDASTGIKTPTGKMINSNGDKDGAAWGEKAEWVDYSGKIGNASYGVAMFDAPDSLRHPTTWHAREYGLFAINPFGLHDFKRGNEGAGNHVVAVGESLNLHYAVYFHRGDTIAADVAGHYISFIEPPKITFP